MNPIARRFTARQSFPSLAQTVLGGIVLALIAVGSVAGFVALRLPAVTAVLIGLERIRDALVGVNGVLAFSTAALGAASIVHTVHGDELLRLTLLRGGDFARGVLIGALYRLRAVIAFSAVLICAAAATQIAIPLVLESVFPEAVPVSLSLRRLANTVPVMVLMMALAVLSGAVCGLRFARMEVAAVCAMLLLAAPLLPTRLIVQATPEVLFTLNGRMLEPALSLQQIARWVVIPAIWIAWGGLLWWQALRSRKEL